MATTLEELVVKIQGDVADLNAKFEEASKTVSHHTEGMASAIAAFTDISGHHFMDFGRVAETALGVFAGDMLTEGLHKIAETIKEVFEEGIKAASAYEQSLNRLGIALASSGNYSAEAAKEMQEFAEHLQNQSKFSEQAILGASALIETLGKLDRDGLQRATNAAVNLAAALQIDLHTAAMLVGKAAEGNITTFTRYGMAIDQGATKAETFANALAAIEAMGNVAEGQLSTFSGAVTQLGFGWEDLSKQFGFAIIQNQAVTQAFGEASKILKEMAARVAENKDQIKIWIAEGLIIAIESVRGLVIAMDILWRGAKVVFDLLTTEVKLMTAAFAAAGLALKGQFTEAFNLLKEAGKDAIRDVVKDATADTGLTAISKLLEKLAEGATKGFGEVMAGSSAAKPHIQNLHKDTKELSFEMEQMGLAGKKLADALTTIDPSKAMKEQDKAIKAQLELRQITLDQAHKKELAALTQKEQTELQIMKAARDQNKISSDEYEAAKIAQAKKSADEQLELQAKIHKEDQQQLQQRLGYASEFFGNLSSLSKTKNAELFEIGKQAAAAQAIVDGFAAVQKTLASVPYPFSIPMAAAAGIAAAVNVSNIEQSHLASGIDSVPGMGFQDNYPAILAPGERVVPSKTNQDLTEFLSSQNAQDHLLSDLGSKLDTIAGILLRGMSINIDGREVFSVMRNQLRSGRAFA